MGISFDLHCGQYVVKDIYTVYHIVVKLTRYVRSSMGKNINGKSNPYSVRYDEVLYDVLFNRSLIECVYGIKKDPDKPVEPHIGTMATDKIMPVYYSMNSSEYRSPDFTSPADILVLGCSNSFGVGLPEEFTWGNILADSLGRSHHKLATPGDSAMGQVYKAFKYFKEVGHPKMIVGIFPARRMEMPLVFNKWVKEHGRPIHKDAPKPKKNNVENNFMIQQISLESKTYIEFAKAPFDPEAVIPAEVSIFYTFMFVQMLEQYCKANHIKFIWNLWDDNPILDYVKENQPDILNNYVEINIPRYTTNLKKGIMEYNEYDGNGCRVLDCHPEHKDHPLYHYASDFLPNKNPGHWGIHLHRHIAETLVEYYKRGRKQ